MNSYQIKITLKSDTLIGLGEGYGTIIDTDVVLDEVGLPFIPAKRIKGIMLESAEELNKMFKDYNKQIKIDEIFGVAGGKEGQLHLSNFFLKDYDSVKIWLNYLINEKNIISKQNITKQLTSLRYSTAIDSTKGFAKEHSLRTERVIDKNNVFIANMEFSGAYENDIALICQNMRRMGTKRTRGLGEIEVVLIKNGKNLNDVAVRELEKEALS